jgi:hypothetical protein
MFRRRAPPEQIVHKSIVAHLKARGAPDVVFLHPANGGARSPVEGAILKSMGVVPGAPDLLLFHRARNGDARAFALELKAEDGRLSEAQAEMLRRLAGAGVITAVCHGIDCALKQLEDWELLRGHVS